MNEIFETYNLALEVARTFQNELCNRIAEKGDGEKPCIFEFYEGLTKDFISGLGEELAQDIKRAKEHHARMERLNGNIGLKASDDIDPDVYRYGLTVPKKYNFDESYIAECLIKGENENMFIHIMDRTGFTQCQALNRAEKAFLTLSNIASQDTEVTEAMSEFEKLSVAANVATVLQNANRFLCDALVFEEENYQSLQDKMQEYLRMIYKSETALWKPYDLPNEKENPAIWVPTIVATVVGVIGGSIVGQALELTLPLQPIGLLLGAIVFTINKIRKSKQEKKYAKKVKAVNDANEKKFEEAYTEFLQGFTNEIGDSFYSWREELVSVCTILAEECRKILNSYTFQFLPVTYKTDARALRKFVEYFADRRAENLQQAVNLYVSEKTQEEYREEMKRLEEERLEIERRAVELKRQSEEERLKLLNGILRTVGKIQEQEKTAQAQRHKDAENLRKGLSEMSDSAERMRKEAESAKEEMEKLRKELEL